VVAKSQKKRLLPKKIISVMKTIKITGEKRNNFGKASAKRLRKEGYVTGVLYRNNREVKHLCILRDTLKNLIYTPEAHFVDLHVEGASYQCKLQGLQEHVVSDQILDIELLEISPGKSVKMDIPIVFVGNSPGIAKGGILKKRLRKVTVTATPEDMPAQVEVDISSLDLGNTARIKHIVTGKYSILNNSFLPVATIAIPRSLRTKSE
jgi:large subunit ribosomal protein L25